MDDPVEKYMIDFEEAKPLPANLLLKETVMRFHEDSAVPVVDDWGSCIGIVHLDDCNEVILLLGDSLAVQKFEKHFCFLTKLSSRFNTSYWTEKLRLIGLFTMVSIICFNTTSMTSCSMLPFNFLTFA